MRSGREGADRGVSAAASSGVRRTTVSPWSTGSGSAFQSGRGADANPPRRCLGGRWLLPIPILEQIGDGKLETGQEILPVEPAAAAQQGATRGGVTNLDAFFLGIDDPGELRAAGEEISEPFIDLGSRVTNCSSDS